MIKFLFVIFVFFLLLMALLGFSVFRTIKNFFFGSSENQKRVNAERRQKEAQRRNQEESYRKREQKKVFSDDEGEYVDYEEVK